MGFIDRSHDGGTYHYARANGSANVFWTTANYNTAGVGAPVASLVDLYHRETVHVLSGNYIISYKRATKTVTTGVTNNVWRWHTFNPMTAVGLTYKTDSGNGRMFRRLIQSSATPGYVSKQSTDYGATSYREELTMPFSGLALWALEVFQITTTATPLMQVMSAIPATGIGLPTNDTFRGVTIEEATYKHFLFTVNAGGATPSPMIYYVRRNNANDEHHVFNLKPNQVYSIAEDNTGLPAGYYKYTLTETSGAGFTASQDGGTIDFTPATIGTPGIRYVAVGVVDGFAPLGSSTIGTTSIFGVGVSDSVTAVDSVSPSGTTSSDTFPVSILDTSSSPVDTVSLGVTANVRDSGGSTNDTVGVVVIGAPHSVWTEKRIDGPITSLAPNQDLLANFFVSEPNDGVFYTKVNDSDDEDFIRVTPLPQVSLSDLRFGLTDSSGSVSTIRSVQFAVKIRRALFTAIDGPFLHVNLYRGDVSANITDWSFQLMQIDNSMWLRSPVISVVIGQADIPGLILRLRPRANGYFGSYGLDISGVLVDVSGDPAEKLL